MKVFYVIRKVQIFYFVVFLIFLIMAGSFFFMLSPLFSPSTDLFYKFICGFFFVVTLMPILVSFWIGFLLYAARKVTLVFDDQGIQLTSLSRYYKLLPSWLRPFKIKYEEIVKVGFLQSPTTVELVNQKGRKNILFPYVFDNRHGEAILEELSKRLPMERFEPGWTTSVSVTAKTWTKTNKIQTAIGVVLLIALILTMALDKNNGNRFMLTDAWKVEKRFPMFENSEAFSLESPGGYWAVTDKLGQNFIYHIHDGKDDKWKMPPVDSKQRIEFVSGVASNPIVWTDTEVWSLDGEWQNVSYQNNLDLSPAYNSGTGTGDKLWVTEILEDRPQFLQVDAKTGNWEVISLPGSAIRDNLTPQILRRALNNDILVMMGNKDFTRIYLFSDGTWKTQEYAIELPELNYVQDFFLDTEENLWVLNGPAIKDTQSIAKISPAGEVAFTYLPLLSSEKYWHHYDSLLVDLTGRIWVSGGIPPSISVFLPNWNGEAELRATYSEDNSNYRQDFLIRPVMSSDGRIWAIGDFLSVMDTNSKELPAPLPDWFSGLDINKTRLLILGFFMIYEVYMLITQARSRIKSRK
jgi:hypothetical protein